MRATSRARGTQTEKLQRVAQVAESILEGNPLLRITDRAGDVDQHDAAAGAANEMVVVFARVADLIVAARALQVHLVDQMKFLHQQDHSKDRGVVWARSLLA